VSLYVSERIGEIFGTFLPEKKVVFQKTGSKTKNKPLFDFKSGKLHKEEEVQNNNKNNNKNNNNCHNNNQNPFLSPSRPFAFFFSVFVSNLLFFSSFFLSFFVFLPTIDS
jgi:hypothetical protein